ncbi:MAG: NosD domain-containing protein [Candidatus Thermoplasmatota archaeon]|nr:NosD domain-containing protein [Candidatus Thermoplasmatota archaeon]
MNKIITLAIAFLIFVPFASINGSNVHTIITSNGVLYVGGSGPNNYTSIQSAINDAENGYTIFVYYGNYNESVVINKSISLIGIEKNGEKPIIDGGGRNFAVNITADRCTLKGFVMKSKEVLVAPEEPPACKIRSDGNVIEYNTFMYGRCSFYLDQSSYNSIKNNEITKGYWSGLQVDHCENNFIIHNTLKDNMAEGLEINGGSNNVVSYNNITKNCDGIELWYTDDAIISFNHIYSNDQYGITACACSNLSILNNSIHNHAYGGLLLTDCSYCTISGNEIYSNQGGVMIQSGTGYITSNNNVVTWNEVYSNGVGIYLEFYCENNHIKYNNLIDNDRNAYFWFFEQPFPNVWDRNYWSDWSLSTPKPVKGTLDVVIDVFRFSFLFRIPWFMFDKHPAMEPYGNFTLNAEHDGHAMEKGFIPSLPLIHHPLFSRVSK